MKRSWDVLTYHPGRDTLPPDLTPVHQDPEKECAREWHDFVCTRTRGHTGRHAAGDSEVIVAVWPEKEEDS